MVGEIRETLWITTVSDDEIRAEMDASLREEAAPPTAERAAIRVAAGKYTLENGADSPVLHAAFDYPVMGDLSSTPVRLHPEEALRQLRRFV
jgi:hypothetical protein